MSTGTFERLTDRFDPGHLVNRYGTTEVYGTLAYVDLQDVGKPAVVGPANVSSEIETRIVEFGSEDPAATVEPGTEGAPIVNTGSTVSFSGFPNEPSKLGAAIHGSCSRPRRVCQVPHGRRPAVDRRRYGRLRSSGGAAKQHERYRYRRDDTPFDGKGNFSTQ